MLFVQMQADGRWSVPCPPGGLYQLTLEGLALHSSVTAG